jgi:hypothetical protein
VKGQDRQALREMLKAHQDMETKEGTAQLAKTVGGYYNALIAMSVTHDTAAGLTMQFQSAILNAGALKQMYQELKAMLESENE